MQWSREYVQRLHNDFFTQILIDIDQVTFEFKVKRHIVYLSSLILEEAYLGRWPRFKEECMGSRGLFPNSSFYF
jgi:hypothetical protein